MIDSRRISLLFPAVAATLALLITSVVQGGMINGDFSSTTLTHGNGEVGALGNGWYAKNADDGFRTDPINWSTGATVGTPGVMTHLSNSGSKTRFGQYFTNELTGTGWSFDFDLTLADEDNGNVELMRVWAGTLAANPSGRAINIGSDTAPAATLVDADGWTEIVNTGSLTTSGHRSFAITQDLGDYNVMIVKGRARSAGVGATYDNFAFVASVPEPSTLLLGAVAAMGLLFGALVRRRRL